MRYPPLLGSAGNLSHKASLFIQIACIAAVLGSLSWLSTWSYLAFHSLAELFSIIVAAAIFVIAWNTRDTTDNGYVIFVGIAFFFVAFLDLAHTLAYEGMGVFPGYGANTATQLWIASCGLQALSLMIAPLFFSRRVRPLITVAVYMAAVALLILSIFSWGIFPTCYIDGYGLTRFKIVAEYVICVMLGLAIAGLWVNRRRFSRPVGELLFGAVVVIILSELAFTRYVAVYGDFNMIGHLLKIVAFLLLYKAIVETGFRRPYELVYRSLAESERKFRSVVESNMVGVLFTDPVSGVIREANDEFLRIVRRTRAELDAGEINWKGMTQIAGAAGRGAAATESHVASFETEYIHPDGARIPVIVGGAFLDDNRSRMVAYILDNTGRKHHEQMIQQAKEDAEKLAEVLARSNRELEQFGYVISHDLQEPLRSISGFLGLLENRYAANLDDKAKQYISYALDGAGRMSRLIHDLLEYSRIGRQKREVEVIEMRAVIDLARANCTASIKEANAVVTCGGLPAVPGDKRQFVQLFQNLIANAVKFRRPNVQPEVHVAATRDQDRWWLFQVRDNGIGIEKEQIPRLFQPFRRLHKNNEYSGTGIGLALCRKIVELHGGRIWIESEPGAGTNVSFTLPAD